MTEKKPVEENVEIVNFITLTRIYDVLIAMLDEINQEKARKIVALHAEGQLLAPPPAIRAEEE